MRVKLFIDGQNFYNKMVRSHGEGARINYDQLAEQIALAVNAVFSGAHYYIGMTPNAPDSVQKFITGLEYRKGYFVNRTMRQKRTVSCTNCHTSNFILLERGVDTQLSVEMVQFAATRAMDIAVLCGGDNDYIPAVKAANALGVQTWLAIWTRETEELRTHCFGEIDLSLLSKHFMLTKGEQE